MPDELDDPFGKEVATGKHPLPPPPDLPPPARTSVYDSVRSWNARTNFLNTVLGIVVAMSTIGGIVWTFIDDFSTDTERKHALNHHDHGNSDDPEKGRPPHPVYDRRIKELEREKGSLQRRLFKIEKDMFELWKARTRSVAVDREEDRPLKAAAGIYYQSVFEDVWRDHKEAPGWSMERAHREALRRPWYDRPRRR